MSRSPYPTPHEMSDLASSLALWPVGVVRWLLLRLPAEGSTAWCMLPCLRCVCVCCVGRATSFTCCLGQQGAHIICSTTCTFEGERRRALNHFIIYYMKSTLVGKKAQSLRCHLIFIDRFDYHASVLFLLTVQLQTVRYENCL